MAPSPYTNMTTRGMSASGSSKPPASGRVTAPKVSGKAPPAKKVVLPKVLPYPKCHCLGVCTPQLRDRLCYIIRHYGSDGLSVLIMRDAKQDRVTVLCGDWNGNNIDLDHNSTDRIIQAAFVFINEDLPIFIRTMQLIKLFEAQFFLALDNDSRLTLVDIQTSVNKLTGPGMVRDIFGKIYRTQEIIKVEALDERALEYLDKGTGSYEGDLIIKPSQYKVFSPSPTAPIVPLYAEVRR